MSACLCFISCRKSYASNRQETSIKHPLGLVHTAKGRFLHTINAANTKEKVGGRNQMLFPSNGRRRSNAFFLLLAPFLTHRLTHAARIHRTQARRQAMEVDKDDAIITSPDKKRTKVDVAGDEESDDDDVSFVSSACPSIHPSARLDSFSRMICCAGIVLTTARPRQVPTRCWCVR